MSYTQFQSDMLPSPFVAVDQILNTLVYGSFYDMPMDSLRTFLVPKAPFGSPQSYLLGSLYSYLSLETVTTTIVYIWHRDISTPLSSADHGMEFVLGKTINYDRDLLSQLSPFSCELKNHFGRDDVIWSQHCYYASLYDYTLIPLMLPYDWLQSDDHKFVFDQFLLELQQKNDVACVLIDDFEIAGGEEHIDLVVANHSLSKYFSHYAVQTHQQAHVLMLQPSTNDENEDRSWGVLGLG